MGDKLLSVHIDHGAVRRTFKYQKYPSAIRQLRYMEYSPVSAMLLINRFVKIVIRRLSDRMRQPYPLCGSLKGKKLFLKVVRVQIFPHSVPPVPQSLPSRLDPVHDNVHHILQRLRITDRLARKHIR